MVHVYVEICSEMILAIKYIQETRLFMNIFPKLVESATKITAEIMNK